MRSLISIIVRLQSQDSKTFPDVAPLRLTRFTSIFAEEFTFTSSRLNRISCSTENTRSTFLATYGDAKLPPGPRAPTKGGATPSILKGNRHKCCALISRSTLHTVRHSDNARPRIPRSHALTVFINLRLWLVVYCRWPVKNSNCTTTPFCFPWNRIHAIS